MSRIKEKILPLNGETYRLRKFPAIEGAYFMKLVIEKFIPAIGVVSHIIPAFSNALKGNAQKKGEADVPVSEIDVDSIVSAVLPVLTSISKEDLSQMMTDCLNRCDKVLPAGPQPVMIGKEYGIPDLEDDPVTCLVLCYRVLEFNMQGFFGEGGSLFSPTMMQRMLQLVPQTSTNGPGRQ